MDVPRSSSGLIAKGDGPRWIADLFPVGQDALQQAAFGLRTRRRRLIVAERGDRVGCVVRHFRGIQRDFWFNEQGQRSDSLLHQTALPWFFGMVCCLGGSPFAAPWG